MSQRDVGAGAGAAAAASGGGASAMREEPDSVLNPRSITFLDDIYRLMVDEALVKGVDRASKVVEFLHPEELKAKFDLGIEREGTGDAALLDICRNVVRYSVRAGHPRHFNLLYSGLDTKALAGAWLTESLNCNLHIYEAAPVFTLMENQTVKELSTLMGFPDGDGVFVPGSSFGNFMAIHLARFRQCGDVKKTGLFGLPRLVLFCSVESHYSMGKAAHLLGFGSDSLRYIETDEGCMKPDALERAILDSKAAGEVPLMVTATSGTTVLGAFDRLREIATICARHQVWLHCDAAWGGGVLYSKQHRPLMDGVELCDSVVWSLHKLVGAQVQCAALIVKQKGLLEACNSSNASYLFPRDKFYDVSYDIGDKTVQCGRKVDSFKFWLMWKSLGHAGMERHVDNALDNARYITEAMRKKPGFRLVRPSFQYVNVCFWYIPLRLRGRAETEEWWTELGKIAPRIKAGMMLAGSTLVSYQPMESQRLVNFFRIIVGNACSHLADLDFVVDEIDRLGRDL